MFDSDIALIQEFHHRFRRLCDSSGYGLIYETLALMREFIPCQEIGFVIGKTASESLGNLWPNAPPRGVATPSRTPPSTPQSLSSSGVAPTTMTVTRAPCNRSATARCALRGIR
jgi:hypothetical protein